MTILTVGIDLAKNVFAVHGVNATGGVQLRQPKVARAKLNALVASLRGRTISNESRSTSWYRPGSRAPALAASAAVTAAADGFNAISCAAYRCASA